MKTVADCKNYANMVQSLTGVDLVNDFFTGNVNNVDKIRDCTSNRKANYGIDSNKPFSNAIIPDIIVDYGKDHNIDIIASYVHKPETIGGEMEDYTKAKLSVELFKKKRGLLETHEVNEPEVLDVQEEEVKARTR